MNENTNNPEAQNANPGYPPPLPSSELRPRDPPGLNTTGVRPNQPRPIPSALFRESPGANADQPQDSSLFAGFSGDFQPMQTNRGLLNVLDNLLKHPARVSHEVTLGGSIRTRLALLAVLIVCLLTYGLIMGSFTGGPQWWLVPLKVLLGTLLSAAICLPSLYIFTALSGGSRSFVEITSLLLQALALCGVLLVGFAPVAWIFSQSTDTVTFMGVLHLFFWAASLSFGLILFRKAFGHLNDNRTTVLKLWNLVFVVVVLQMCTTLRPLVGPFEGYKLQPKKFFAAHFFDPR